MFAFLKKVIEKPTYYTATDIAVFFNLSARELNLLFVEIGWANKEGSWWIATKTGILNGAVQEYNPRNKQKFIKWNSTIKENETLIRAIERFKAQNETKLDRPSPVTEKDDDYTRFKKSKTTHKQKIEKGQKYEAYVAEFFREQGYYVWEHGKEKGKNDGGIDLFIKKDKFVYFVQCKNWESWKVDDKTVKSTQTDVRNYMLENSELTNLLSGCTKKILYVTSKASLTKGAYRYIKENEDIFEHQVIPMSK